MGRISNLYFSCRGRGLDRKSDVGHMVEVNTGEGGSGGINAAMEEEKIERDTTRFIDRTVIPRGWSKGEIEEGGQIGSGTW